MDGWQAWFGISKSKGLNLFPHRKELSLLLPKKEAIVCIKPHMH